MGLCVAASAADDARPSPPAAGGTSAYIGPPPELPPPPPLPVDADARRLVERAQARWNALIDGDFARAYTYEPPEFRARHDVESYRGKFGPLVRWHGAEVRQLRRLGEDAAELGVVLDHSFAMPGQTEPVRDQTLVWEQWVQEKGEWWHQGQWSNIPGSAGGDSGQ